jgi:hypothetical protein
MSIPTPKDSNLEGADLPRGEPQFTHKTHISRAETDQVCVDDNDQPYEAAAEAVRVAEARVNDAVAAIRSLCDGQTHAFAPRFTSSVKSSLRQGDTASRPPNTARRIDHDTKKGSRLRSGLDPEIVPEPPKSVRYPNLRAAPELNGDRAVPELQRGLALDPASEASIGEGSRSWTIATLRTGGLLAFAAIVAWVIISAPAVKLWAGNVISTSLLENDGSARVPAAPRSPPEVNKTQRLDESVATARQPRVAQRPSAESRSDAVPGGALPLSTVTVASIAPTAAPAAREAHPPVEAMNFVSRHIERSELDAMLERANDFIKSDDLSSARLLLRRAAEAGDARAAFTLAGTFDPNVLKELGLRDSVPDLSQARLWYDRAAKLGSAEATRRVQQLATVSAH